MLARTVASSAVFRKTLCGAAENACASCILLRRADRNKSIKIIAPDQSFLQRAWPSRNYSATGEVRDNVQGTWLDLRQKDKFILSVKTRVLELDEVIELIREEGGVDIVAIKVPEEMCYVDYFIVATASSPRHLGSIAEIINKLYKRKRQHDQPFTVIEGKKHSDDWQCIDIGNMVIHVMLEETREEYNLEKLWLLGPKHDDELHNVPSNEEIMQQLTMQGLNLMSMNEDTVKALGNLDFSSPWEVQQEDFDPEDEDSINSPASNKPKDDELGDDDAFLV